MATYETRDNTWTLNEFPPICPRCKRHIAAISEARGSEVGLDGIECVFRCPACRRLFIGSYFLPTYASVYDLSFSLPSSYTKREFPRLGHVSKSFENLYNQSAQADAGGLDEIAGTGYRKSLEFLVKDFCIALKPEKSEEVRKLFLGNVIRDFVDDGKLKRAATLTSWLGNDEGHYEKRWNDKDLKDLKSLLELTIAFVDEEIQLELYSRSMQPTEPHRLTFVGDPPQS